jgi:hypothetical protein
LLVVAGRGSRHLAASAAASCQDAMLL